jgi:hypothetical protein
MKHGNFQHEKGAIKHGFAPLSNLAQRPMLSNILGWTLQNLPSKDSLCKNENLIAQRGELWTARQNSNDRASLAAVDKSLPKSHRKEAPNTARNQARVLLTTSVPRATKPIASSGREPGSGTVVPPVVKLMLARLPSSV